jgi:putative YhbY family RNA-binding protein
MLSTHFSIYFSTAYTGTIIDVNGSRGSAISLSPELNLLNLPFPQRERQGTVYNALAAVQLFPANPILFPKTVQSRLSSPLHKAVAMLTLSTEERRALRARAHSLSPVVSIAQNGLADSVMKEIDRSLTAHELIKARVYHDDRAVREEYFKTICETLDAAPVQHLGKLLILWRPAPEEKKTKKTSAKTTKRRMKRDYQNEK